VNNTIEGFIRLGEDAFNLHLKPFRHDDGIIPSGILKRKNESLMVQNDESEAITCLQSISFMTF
jgi:hypothetical protein